MSSVRWVNVVERVVDMPYPGRNTASGSSALTTY
jgi:hypothetical protein